MAGNQIIGAQERIQFTDVQERVLDNLRIIAGQSLRLTGCTDDHIAVPDNADVLTVTFYPRQRCAGIGPGIFTHAGIIMLSGGDLTLRHNDDQILPGRAVVTGIFFMKH